MKENNLKKGDLGELIVTRWLEGIGHVVYRPFTRDKKHRFDIMDMKNKANVIVIDVKTKAALNISKESGCNVASYNSYISFAQDHNFPFFLFFVDDKSGDVYSINIMEIGRGRVFTDRFGNHIMVWSYNAMEWHFNIGEEMIKELSKYDERSYTYDPKYKNTPKKQGKLNFPGLHYPK
jgi:hypothetical protein